MGLLVSMSWQDARAPRGNSTHPWRLKPPFPSQEGSASFLSGKNVCHSSLNRERFYSPPPEGCRGGSKFIQLSQGTSVRKKIFIYEPHLKDLARELRRRSTLAEILLWRQLRGKRMLGYDFDRQKPIDHYILDFFVPNSSLPLRLTERVIGRSGRRIEKDNCVWRSWEFVSCVFPTLW